MKLATQKFLAAALWACAAAPSFAKTEPTPGWADDARTLVETYAAPNWRDTEALCSQTQSLARNASSFGCYRGFSAPQFEEFERRSVYVPMRDGVRLAVDIYRPADGGAAVAAPLPVVFTYSRYWRATEMPDGDLQISVGRLGRGETGGALDVATSREPRSTQSGVALLVAHGYVYVRAEARGTGASFGVRTGDMSGVEARDAYDIIAWINQQPWANGRVGMIGASYEGMSQFLTASAAPPGLRAIFPAVATFDEYRASWSGAGVLRKYGLAWLAREARRDGVQSGVAGSVVNPNEGMERIVARVDEDRDGVMRQAARLERASDPEAVDPTVYFTRQAPAARELRDALAQALGSNAPIDIIEALYDSDRLEALVAADESLRERLLALRFTRDASSMLTSPQDTGPNNLAMLAPRIRASGIAVYNWGGWRDFATLDTLLWHANLDQPRKLAMGPWTHGPNEPNDRREDASRRLRPIEQLRWLDYWLKDIDNGIMEEPAVHYAISDDPGHFVWRSAPDWPPRASQRRQRWALTHDGRLALRAQRGDTSFTVDYSSSLGDHTRYHDAIGLGPLTLPDLEEHAQRGALSFTTAPLRRDTTLVGSPIVSLLVRASTASAVFHAYLQEIDPNGHVELLSEGVMHSAHRTLGQPAYNNLSLPFSDSRRAVVESTPPLNSDNASVVQFDLQPASETIQRGNRIRLVITGAEARTNLVIPYQPPTQITISTGRDGSILDLPVAP